MRRRRDEWTAAGVFAALRDEALAGYDRIIGLDLSEVAVDGSQHKAPFGGEGTGPNPTDRGKCGWKWSIATDRNGIPVGWAIDGANRNDCVLFVPTITQVVERDHRQHEIVEQARHARQPPFDRTSVSYTHLDVYKRQGP